MRRLILLAAAAGVIAACAQQGFPPGGPELKVPPKLLRISPDSDAVNVRIKDVELWFDAVVSEKPAGATDLAGLVLVSPRDGPPHVGWHRTRLTIRGKDGWRPNTAYSVTVLPGLADLHGNATKQPIRLVFSTGPTIPSGFIAGNAFDWGGGKPLARAMVNAISRPDSIVYVARADSSGRFLLSPLPGGEYTVLAWNDANNDQELSPREMWDSVHITLSDTARTEILAFVHDTVGPRISAVDVRDSVTLRVTFDKPLQPSQPIDTTVFALSTIDSTPLAIRLVQPSAAFDRARQDSLARVDTAKARADSAAALRQRAVQRRFSGDSVRRVAAPVPTASRPTPTSEVIIVPAVPFVPGSSYRLQAKELHNLLGYANSSVRTFTAPKPTPLDSLKKARAAQADSIKRRAPAQPPRPDSSAPPRPPTAQPPAQQRPPW